MFGIHDLTLFIISGFLLNIMPGPDTLLIMSKSASQGWRAGSVASLGIGSGVFVHVLAAALGVSAILASSATAFTIVKYAGAAYLVYIGIMALRQKAKNNTGTDDAESASPVSSSPLSMRSIYWQGFLSNALNPKVALFFLAFVPQFISHDSPDKALAFIILGVIFNFNSMLWCHFLAVFTSLASKRLKVSKSLSFWLNKTIGVMFISLGFRLALTAKS